MADQITAHSTTDTPADVRAALGLAQDPDAPVVEETPLSTATATTSAVAEDTKPAEPDTPAAEPPAPAAPEDEDLKALEALGEDDPEDTAAAEAASAAGRTLAKQKVRIEKRIARLTKEKHTTARERDEAQARATQLQQELEALKRGDPPAPAAPPAPVAKPADGFTEPRPVQDDFEDFDKFLEARDAWTEKRTEFITRQAIERERAEQQRQAEIARLNAELDRRYAASREKHPDLDAVIEAAKDIRVPEDVIHYVRESEHGAELTYYLATHPDEATALNTMSPRAALAAIGRIEAKVIAPEAPAAAEPAAPPAPTPKTVPLSKAPAPVSTVRTGSTAATQKNPDDMTQAEFNAWRDEQERRRRAS